MRRKNKVDFVKAFWKSSFKITYFQNNFLHATAVLGYLPKLKGSVTSFWCTFCAWFFRKIVLYIKLYQWTKFQCYTFSPSQDIKQNVLLTSYLDSYDVMNFKIYFGLTSKAITDREKKRRRWKHKNLNVSRLKRAF